MNSPAPLFDDPDSPPGITYGSQGSAVDGVKVINDPIHGHFELPAYVLDVVDTPHIQRLRELKQLGCTYYVYPGASHNRFEHSVGVSHLSASFVHGLYSSSRDRRSESAFDNKRHFCDSLRIVEIAGLCHDLGHGPFSHLFDHVFLPNVSRSGVSKDHPNAEHEVRSVMLLEHLIDTYNLEYDIQSVRQISSLITGRRPPSGRDSLVPQFLYDVVSNSTSGVDTDKFDYLARDVYNVGLQGNYGFDHSRLMKFAKVVDDSICFHRKEIFNVYHLFLTRFQLHRTVYNHRASVSIDAMITDAFLEADPILKISDSITDPVEFMSMTDNLLHTIQYSKSPRLSVAKEIVERLRRRNLYCFVDEILLPAGCTRKIRPEEITTCQESGSAGVHLVPNDIVLAPVTLNFGMKNQNPVDKVLFFKDWEDNSPIHISSRKVSYVLPAQFEEKILRVYLRKQGAASDVYRKAAKKAFRNFLRRASLGSPLPSPPQHSVSLSNGKSLTRPHVNIPIAPLETSAHFTLIEQKSSVRSRDGPESKRPRHSD